MEGPRGRKILRTLGLEKTDTPEIGTARTQRSEDIRDPAKGGLQRLR